MWTKLAVLASLSCPLSLAESTSKADAENRNVEARTLANRASHEALKIEDDIERLFVLSEVAGLQARVGDLSAAFATVKAIEQTSSITRNTARLFALKNIAVGQAQTGNLRAAVRTMGETKSSIQMVAAREIALAHLRSGKLEEALWVAQKVELPHSRVRVLLTVAKATDKGGGRPSAKKIIQMCREITKKINNKERRDEAWQDIARGLARMGDHDEAHIRGAVSQGETQGRRRVRLASVSSRKGPGGSGIYSRSP